MFKFFYKISPLWVLLITFNLHAQNTGLSPYSKTALGDISNETGNRDADMGYTGTGSYSNNALSFANPAYLHNEVYPLLPSKFAYFDFSLTSRAGKYTSSTGNDASFGANLNRMAILLPMNKNKKTVHKWGSLLVAKPYASMNYDIAGSGIAQGDTLSYTYSNNGKGGLSEILWGNGVKLSKNLMVGLNTSYIFGKYTKSNTTQLEGSGNTYAYVDESRQSFLLLKPGIAYVKNLEHFDSVKITYRNVDTLTGLSENLTRMEYRKIPSRMFFNIGATYEYGYALVNTSNVSKKVYDVNLTEYIIDTLGMSDLSRYNLPGGIKVGASFTQLDEFRLLPNWTVTLDLGYKQWSQYNPGLGYRNTFTSGFGLEKQKVLGKNQRQKLVYLRTGAYLHQLPYRFGDQYINEMGITFGGTYKLSGVKGLNDIMLLNMSFAVGQRGQNSNNLILDRFIKFTLGFTFLEDRWFRKYRLD